LIFPFFAGGAPTDARFRRFCSFRLPAAVTQEARNGYNFLIRPAIVNDEF
jgi:hypothetical protein